MVQAEGARGLLDFFEQRADLAGVRGVEGFLRHEDLLHGPLAIDDKGGTAREDVLFVEDAVGAADVALGITQHRELHTELLRERGVGPGAIDTYWICTMRSSQAFT